MSQVTPEPLFSQDSFNFLFRQLNDALLQNDGVVVNGREHDAEYQFVENDDPSMNAQFEFKAERFRLHSMPSLNPQDSIGEILSSLQPPHYGEAHFAASCAQPHDNVAGGSNIPSNKDFAGEYGFELSIENPPKETKSASWTYSERLKKLYARMGCSCPIRFRTTRPPPSNSRIRSMPVFMRPDHIQEVVTRCPHHRALPDPRGLAPDSHLLRFENALAEYHTEDRSGRQSVSVPFEPPQAGSEWSTQLLQFMCFSSCPGGLNRRPTQCIFTLESDGRVLGRRVIEFKICACPGRDRKTDERALVPRVPDNQANPRIACSLQLATLKRPRRDDQVFTLEVRGRETYEILKRVRDSLELAAMLPPNQVDELRRRRAESIIPALKEDDEADGRASKPTKPTKPVLERSHSNASTVSISSQKADAAEEADADNQVVLTKYTFRQTISIRSMDHDYTPKRVKDEVTNNNHDNEEEEDDEEDGDMTP